MKNLLFIAEPFYQYSTIIKQTIEEEFDYNVDLLLIVSGSVTNLSKNKRRVHLLDRHNSREFIDANRRTQEIFFKEHKDTEYDVILLLVFSGLCIDLFKDFVKNHKEAKKIIYLWDDVKRVAFFEDVKGGFDRIVSFDKKDCEEYGFEFLPLFFSEEYRYAGEEKKYISTYGTLNSDREQVLRVLLKSLPVKDYAWRVKLIVDKISYMKQIVKFKRSPIKPFYIAFKGVTSEETANVLKHSKVAIDVPVQGQNGLTMRTIETLAAHTKIITTNRNIKEYDFYNADNVEIIDRNDPKIREDFLDSPYTPIKDGIIEKYSLRNWVRRLLICEDKI